MPGEVRLIGKACEHCCDGQLFALAQQLKRETNARLTLIGVRRHAGLAFERAIEPIRRQVRGIGDVIETNALIEMGIEIVSRQTYGAAFAADSALVRRIIDMAIEQPFGEAQIAFVTREPWTIGLSTAHGAP